MELPVIVGRVDALLEMDDDFAALEWLGDGLVALLGVGNELVGKEVLDAMVPMSPMKVAKSVNNLRLALSVASSQLLTCLRITMFRNLNSRDDSDHEYNRQQR